MLRPRTPLFTLTTDSSGGGGGGVGGGGGDSAAAAPENAATGPAEMTPRQAARLEGMPAEAAALIKQRKVERAKAAGTGAAPMAAALSDDTSEDQPAKGDKGTRPGQQAGVPAVLPSKEPEGVISFGEGDDGPDGEGADDDTIPEGDVTIDGLDEAGKKKLAELNHKQQTFRKRTQEAEKQAKEAAEKITAAESKLAELQQELATVRTAPGGNNWLKWATKPEQIAVVKANAQQGLRILQKAMLDPELSKEHTFVDGSKRELTADDLDMFTTYLVHAEERETQLTKHAKSAEDAKKILAKVAGVAGFEKHHQAALGADWDNDRPTLAAKLAIAELALSGEYQLVPKGAKTTLEKAGAATSASLKTGEQAPKTPTQKPAGSPPTALATSMPPVSQGGVDYDALLSAAKARAEKGDEKAVGDMLRIKRERREAQKKAA